jgi:chemosensory pili system protein ChpE
MFSFSLSSFLLGIVFSAPPGVITTEALRRGLKGGFWPAFLVELGSLVGDAAWGILALSGGAFLFQKVLLRVSLGLAGSLFLVYLAIHSFRDMRSKFHAVEQATSKRGHFSSGMLLSLGNPFQVAFWLGVGSSTISTQVTDPQIGHYLLFLAFFMLGALAWCFFLAGLVAWGQRLLKPAFFRWVNFSCGLFLAWFSIQLGWNSLQLLIK